MATECPEGLARKWDWQVRRADLSMLYGSLPGGNGPEQTDHRLMQVVEVVRQLRDEE